MLVIYRRHIKRCPNTSRKQWKCGCPIHVEGKLNGEMVRKTLTVRSREAALTMIREWEIAGRAEAVVTVEDALDKFIADCEARHLVPSTMKKYRLLVKELKSEFQALPVGKISVDDLDGYRKRWGMKANSSRKKLERLRKFFRFCVEREWIVKNPALALDSPKTVLRPTLPFTDTEMENILWATEIYRDDHVKCPKEYARKIRPFVLVLRYAGLRIGDVVNLERERVSDGKLFLYSQKTNVPVWLPLPEYVLKSLEGLDGRFYFWSGNGDLESAVKDWQRTLRQLFRVAGVKAGHAHRFRDTFAVSLLQKGVTLENVAVLLGNSVRIAEKHYAPWVKARQDSLERAVKATWG
jgi:integrase/recombinase XerD